MGLLTLGGSVIAGKPRRLVTPAPPAVLQDRVLGDFMNSLWYEDTVWQSTPRWINALCVADGGKSLEGRGSFGFANDWAFNPPAFATQYTGVTDPDPVNDPFTAWSQVVAAGFTDFTMTPDNFHEMPVRPANPTDPNVSEPPSAGADDYVTEFLAIIDALEANAGGTPNYWVHEGWADGASNVGAGLLYLEADGSSTSTRFANWRSRTTDEFGYGAWFDQCITSLRAARPALSSRINLLPVARTLVSVMENTAASSMASADWFDDNAPHGLDGTYLVAAAVVYSTMFEEVAPTPSFTGTNVHATIQTNWTAIASHIATQVGV